MSLVGVRIKSEFELNNIQFGWVLGAFSLAYAFFEIPSGVLGDRLGPRIVVSRWFPVGESGRALTWVGFGSQIGSAVAPLIIIPVAVSYGLRSSFYVIALIVVVWVSACHRWVRNFPHEVKNISLRERELIEGGCRYNKDVHQLHWKVILRSGNLWALLLMYFLLPVGKLFFSRMDASLFAGRTTSY